jgi:hypothetical protein
VVTQQTVATIYSGLIGKFLDVKTETLPGYTPVIAPPSVELSAAVGVSGATPSEPAPNGLAQVSLQVLGNNPASVPLYAGYVDLGVVLLDPYSTNVGVHTFLDGIETGSPTIDTSTSSAHVIEYRVTDRAGVAIFVRRIVLVGDAVDPGGAISSSGPVLAPPTPYTAPQEFSPPTHNPVPVEEPPVLPTSSSTPLEENSSELSPAEGATLTSEGIAATSSSEN